ncbi:methyltransferase [Methanosarcina sp. 1.H.A.2.2]|nr:methyltransferase [Methanosarcina sp. 1.H.A.2.2]
MTKEEILKGLADAVVEGDDELAEELAQKALDEGVDAYDAIIHGLSRGMLIVSEQYEKGEAYVPQLLIASTAMYAGMDILTPHVKVEGAEKPAVLVIGSVEGDVHDIGKNLVKTLMSAAGFKVIDLGADAPLEKFVEAAKENKADIISMSSLMTTTMTGMEEVIEMLQEEGLRDAVKVIVGGAPISEDFAEKIGADAMRHDASSATEWALEAVKTLPASEERWSEQQIALARTKYRKILAAKVPKTSVDIGRVTAEKVMKEFDAVVPKFVSTMTKAERFTAAFQDKNVDRLPIAPLACGVSRKFVPCTYKDYSTNAEKYAECVYTGIKYFNLDTFVGLTDLCVDAADFGADVRYPEEDTPAAKGHLEDYEKLEVPDLKEGTRAHNLVMGNKFATEKAHSLNATMTALIEGPMVALTQIMGASRVLADIKTNPDVVKKGLEKTTEYVENIMKMMFEEAQPDNLCMVTLWTNNFILSADEYMMTEGAVMQNRIAPLYKRYNKPVVIHNCSDAPHWDLIHKWDTKAYSYTYYPHEADKGSKDYRYLINNHGKETMFMGQTSPIMFLDNSPEGIKNIQENTMQLMEGVLNTLKDNGMQSKYVISTGCEVPPGAPCDSVTAETYLVAEKGPELQKRIIRQCA